MSDRSQSNPHGKSHHISHGGKPGWDDSRGSRSKSDGGSRSRGENNPRVAIPWYACQIGNDFSDAPPGHRYLLYLPFWKDDWSVISSGKQKVLKDLGQLSEHAKKIMRELATRQRSMGLALGAEVIDAVSISPFATGLGWEHPNENGFSFLHPYGLPYLAGSGVKGVLRRAAEELSLFGNEGSEAMAGGWTILDVWWLFGFEGAAGAIWDDKSHWAEAYRRHRSGLLNRQDLPDFLRNLGILDKGRSLEERLGMLEAKRRDLSWEGALRFFDVIPNLWDRNMDVDIMNPHYGDYYQGKSSPHDAGNPVPIFFLVVPSGSKFTFVVDCPREQKLPELLKANWRELVRKTFGHAFDWLGFGAKTAVGYGAMERRSEAETGLQHGGQQSVVQTRSLWLDKKTEELSSKPGVKPDDVLRGKGLAEAVRAIEDPALKKEVLQDIQNRWKEKAWWNNPQGKSAKEAKKIYEEVAREIER